MKKFTGIIRKRKILFKIPRPSPVTLTNRIFTYFHDKETKGAWFFQVERNLQEAGITQQDIQDANI